MNMWICATWASGRMKVKTGLEGLLRPQPHPPLPPPLSFFSLSLCRPLCAALLVRCIAHGMHSHAPIRFDVYGIDAERGRVPVYCGSPSRPSRPSRLLLHLLHCATSDFLVNTYARARVVRDASSDSSVAPAFPFLWREQPSVPRGVCDFVLNVWSGADWRFSKGSSKHRFLRNRRNTSRLTIRLLRWKLQQAVCVVSWFCISR